MRVLTCLVEDHSLMLVALAAVVCVAGSAITINLFDKLRSSRGMSQNIWMVMGGVAGGATIWCTHFVAMLAWQTSLVTTYDPMITGLSLLAAMAGVTVSLRVGAGQKELAPAFGGVLFGLTVSAMHYIGMAGLKSHAILHIDTTYIIASLVLAALVGMAAFVISGRTRIKGRRIWASVALVVSIVSLHFTGMAAINVTLIGGEADFKGTNDLLMALSVAAVGMVLIGSAIAANALQDQAQKRELRRLQALIDGNVDGMAVESGGRILMVNAAFAAMTEVSVENLKGQPVERWIEDAEAMTSMSVVQSRICTTEENGIPVEVTVRIEHDDAGGVIRIFSVRDLRQRLEQERRIAFLARNDSLTGLPNRASFLEKLARMCQLHKDKPGFALFAIDLDRFKDINDIYGHGVGDQMLNHVSNNMKLATREGEFIARLGGDEFVAIVPLSSQNYLREEANAAALRLREAILRPMHGEHTQLGCGASIGIALWPVDADQPNALINNADLAMYRSKASIADDICFYDRSMDEAVRERRRMTQGMREALDRGLFQIYYQPQMMLGTNEVTGYEALIRWPRPDGGYISPVDFIPLAEDTGLILPIGEWVLRRACEEAMQWDKPLRLAVNLSPVQLGQTELPRLVQTILMETGLPASRLELEITETAMITDMARSTHILRQLKALGVSIAMDDFGTGYSSLSTLRAFPFDKIKLDRAFMGELEDSPQSRAIIRAVLTLGESLNIPVLAEGVETSNQLNFLKAQGCDEVQGYLLGRPARELLDTAVIDLDELEDERISA